MSRRFVIIHLPRVANIHVDLMRKGFLLNKKNVKKIINRMMDHVKRIKALHTMCEKCTKRNAKCQITICKRIHMWAWLFFCSLDNMLAFLSLSFLSFLLIASRVLPWAHRHHVVSRVSSWRSHTLLHVHRKKCPCWWKKKMNIFPISFSIVLPSLVNFYFPASCKLSPIV